MNFCIATPWQNFKGYFYVGTGNQLMSFLGPFDKKYIVPVELIAEAG
jgi:hypothetical protein